MKKNIEIRKNSDYDDFYRKIIPESKWTENKLIFENDSVIYNRIHEKYQELPKDEMLFWGWNIIYKYSKAELSNAKYFHLSVTNCIDFFADEFEQVYDNTSSCPICGGGRKQIRPLCLKEKEHEKYEIVRLLSGEIVISENLRNEIIDYGLRVGEFIPVNVDKTSKKYYQISASEDVTIDKETIFGVNPFDLREKDCDEIYKCPNNDTLGLNLLSELYIENYPSQKDMCLTKQYVGVRRGLFRPEPLWICTQKARTFFVERGTKGIRFDIVRLKSPHDDFK